MKTNNYTIFHKLLISIFFISSFSSCEDFFQQPLSYEVGPEEIYQDTINAKMALYSGYYILPYAFPVSSGIGMDGYYNTNKIHQNMTAAISDEGVSSPTWMGAGLGYYNGAFSPLTCNDKFSEFYLKTPYYFMRRIFLFKQNVGKTVGAKPEFIQQTTAEANMLLAFGYIELMKRYGGAPWVGHAYTAEESMDQTRMELPVMVDRIDRLITEAIPHLPHRYPAVEEGRINRASAYFLRSRLWLWAASPLFNTATPYIDNGIGNKFICMGSNDPTHWQKAAEVTKEAIDYCEAQGYTLVNTGSPIEDYTLATRDLYSHTKNSEVILHTRYTSAQDGKKEDFYFRHMVPSKTKSSKGSAACCPTYNFVSMYQTTDGSEVDLLSNNPWEKLDPRFHASVVHDKAKFGGASIGIMGKKDAVADKKLDKYNDAWVSGFWMRKFLREEHYSDPALKFDLPFMMMRLPELYLNYAEALNEVTPGHGDIVEYANKTRERVGMPKITATGQEEWRKEIHKERGIEFAFEDMRYFDLKRWLKGEQIGETKYGVKRLKDGGYEVAEISNERQYSRGWEDKYYLNPFPDEEIMKGFGLSQNPGY